MSDENRLSGKSEKPILESDLVSLHSQFMVLVNDFLLKWCDEQIRSVVRENAEKAKALGATGLHKMKTEYEEFVSHMPSDVEKFFSSGKYWPHLRRSDDLSKEVLEGKYTLEQIQGHLSDGIREIQGRLGALLMKYKFASVRDPYGKWGVDADDRAGHLRFKSKFTFTAEMNSILEKYLELYNQTGKQQILKSEKKQEELEAEAKDSWDQA